ncbi:hypothetical protein [Bacillus chungangensis]|uniref:Uncharacterized protein n=1 Tax=Bacillus chungangensis TaxID=587633 RepID=A0ABT9WMK0_9BACI|nr:hypothetical protein [Bacillus chungangensis]MDQ0174410.1 hypothetical protein [Bacillus chungangensis]
MSLDRYWIPVVFFSEDRKLHVTNEIVRYSSKPVSVEELATLEKVLEEWLDWLEVGAGGDLSE